MRPQAILIRTHVVLRETDFSGTRCESTNPEYEPYTLLFAYYYKTGCLWAAHRNPNSRLGCFTVDLARNIDFIGLIAWIDEKTNYLVKNEIRNRKKKKKRKVLPTNQNETRKIIKDRHNKWVEQKNERNNKNVLIITIRFYLYSLSIDFNFLSNFHQSLIYSYHLQASFLTLKYKFILVLNSKI